MKADWLRIGPLAGFFCFFPSLSLSFIHSRLVVIDLTATA